MNGSSGPAAPFGSTPSGPESTASRPPAHRLIEFATLAFLVDVLVYYFTARPLVTWSLGLTGAETLGILVQYGLRGAAAGIIAAAMILSGTASLRDFGITGGSFAADFRWTLRVIAALLAVSVVLMALAVAVLRVIRPPLDGWPLELEQQSVVHFVLVSLLAAPLVEEFVYRSLIVPGLRAGYLERGAIGAGAVVFYTLHLVYGLEWWKLHYAVAGAILTWAFLRRPRLWICAVLHAGANVLVITDDLLWRWAPGVFEWLVGGRPRP